MQIVREEDQTDPVTGIITLADDRGARTHYVRRDNNATLEKWFDLVLARYGLLEFAQDRSISEGTLPGRITVALTVGSVTSAGALNCRMGEIISVHEYRAEPQAFLLWQLFRAYRLRKVRPDVNSLLDQLHSATPDHNWNAEEIEDEWVLWCRDKRQRNQRKCLPQ